MENKDKILSELRGISKVLASLSREHPFHTPSLYFEGLAGEVIKKIKFLEEHEEVPAPFRGMERNTPFEIPARYFESLPAIILSRIKAAEASSPEEELKVLSPLLGQLEKKHPFTLPNGYFEDLPEDIISGLNAIDFVNHELETLSPVMSAIQNKNVYTVPEDYFDNLPGAVLNKLKTRQNAKVVSGGFGKKILRYAAAAMIAGAIAVGAWVYFQDKPQVSSGYDLAGIKKVSDDEIVKYLDNNSITFPESNGVTASNSVASFDMGEDDVKELLADLPDEELQQYLEQNSASKDLITN